MAREPTTVLGRQAESRALAHLESQGLRLLARNYRCRGGEIDLVMQDGTTLVLVEVRSRSTSDFGGAAASIGPRKQRRFILAARHLLRTNPQLAQLRARFDVVAIDPGVAPGTSTLTWIKHAFAAS